MVCVKTSVFAQASAESDAIIASSFKSVYKDKNNINSRRAGFLARSIIDYGATRGVLEKWLGELAKREPEDLCPIYREAVRENAKREKGERQIDGKGIYKSLLDGASAVEEVERAISRLASCCQKNDLPCYDSGLSFSNSDNSISGNSSGFGNVASARSGGLFILPAMTSSGISSSSSISSADSCSGLGISDDKLDVLNDAGYSCSDLSGMRECEIDAILLEENYYSGDLNNHYSYSTTEFLLNLCYTYDELDAMSNAEIDDILLRK